MKLAIAAAVLIGLTVTAVAADGPENPSEYQKTYAALIAKATRMGSTVEQNCFPDYCANSMTFEEKGDIVFVSHLSFTNGMSAKEFCLGDGQTRRCWWSNGRIADERLVNNEWNTARVIARNYP